MRPFVIMVKLKFIILLRLKECGPPKVKIFDIPSIATSPDPAPKYSLNGDFCRSLLS